MVVFCNEQRCSLQRIHLISWRTHPKLLRTLRDAFPTCVHTLISLGQILNTSSNTRQLPDCCLAASSLQYFSLGRNNLALFPSFCSALFRHESSSFDFWEVFELKRFHLDLILVVSLSYWSLKDTSTFCSRRKLCVTVKCYDNRSIISLLKNTFCFSFSFLCKKILS